MKKSDELAAPAEGEQIKAPLRCPLCQEPVREGLGLQEHMIMGGCKGMDPRIAISSPAPSPPAEPVGEDEALCVALDGMQYDEQLWGKGVLTGAAARIRALTAELAEAREETEAWRNSESQQRTMKARAMMERDALLKLLRDGRDSYVGR